MKKKNSHIWQKITFVSTRQCTYILRGDSQNPQVQIRIAFSCIDLFLSDLAPADYFTSKHKKKYLAVKFERWK